MKHFVLGLLFSVLFFVNINADTFIKDSLYASNINVDNLVKTATKDNFIILNIDSSKRAGDNLADIISREPGINFRRYGGTGSRTTVSIRGISDDKIKIFLDGASLNSSMGGAVDLSQIDPSSLESIEIYKGYIPAKFGGNGFGGVINLKRKESLKDGSNVNLSALTGSFGEQQYHIDSWFVPHYLVDLFSSFDFHKSDNDYKYLDRNFTPKNIKDDTVRVLENSEFYNFETRIRPTISLRNRKKIFVDIFYKYKNREIPANEGYINQTAKEKENDFNVQSILKSEKISGEKIFGEILFNYNFLNNSFSWTGLDHIGLPHGILPQNGKAELKFNSYKFTLKGNSTFNPTEFLNIDFTLNVDYEKFDPKSIVKDKLVGDWKSYRLTGVVASDLRMDFNYIGGYVGISIIPQMDSTKGGIDNYMNRTLSESCEYKSNWIIRGGATGFLPKKNIKWEINGGRFINTPSLRQMYGAQGGIVANPELLTETLYSFDIGLSLTKKIIDAETGLYFSRNYNGIVYIGNGTFIKPVNIQESRVFGWELSTNIKPIKLFNLKTQLTIQKTENHHPDYEGRELPFQPALSLDNSLNIRPLDLLQITWDLEYKTRYFTDPANSSAIPADLSLYGIGYNSFGMKLGFKHISIETYFKNLPLNLFDKKQYKSYSSSLINDTSGSSYYSEIIPGIKYFVKINFSF